MTYFTTNEVKIILTGGTSDSSFDTMIAQEGAHADIDVENDLFAYSGVTPPFTGDDITEDIASASNWRTAARVFGIIGQLERKKDANEEYSNIIKRMVMRFKATPTTRTKTVSVTTAYRSSPIKDE